MKTLSFPEGIYTGQVSGRKSKQRHGKGVMEWKSGGVYMGAKYVGDWFQNAMHGQGALTYANGDVYEGEWKQGLQHGVGKMTFISGSEYEGDWCAGKKHGQGTYRQANGDVYKGSWHHGVMHGRGIYTHCNGDTYDGRWMNGKKHAQGTYTYRNGDQYVGAWSNDKKHGAGSYTYASGGSYVGQWNNDEAHGHGKKTFASGDVYEGEWLMGKEHGQGMYRWTDGLCYIHGHERVSAFLSGHHRVADPVDVTCIERQMLTLRVTAQASSVECVLSNEHLLSTDAPVSVGRDRRALMSQTSDDRIFIGMVLWRLTPVGRPILAAEARMMALFICASDYRDTQHISISSSYDFAQGIRRYWRERCQHEAPDDSERVVTHVISQG